MPETTPLIKAALNLRVGVGFDVYICIDKPYPASIRLTVSLIFRCTADVIGLISLLPSMLLLSLDTTKQLFPNDPIYEL